MALAQTTASRMTTTGFLERPVLFDTAGRNFNLALIGFIRESLDSFGVSDRVSTDFVGEKASLHAIEATGCEPELAAGSSFHRRPADRLLV